MKIQLQLAVLCGVLAIGAMGGFAAGHIVGQPSLDEAADIVIRSLHERGAECDRTHPDQRPHRWDIRVKTPPESPHGVYGISGVGNGGCPRAWTAAETALREWRKANPTTAEQTAIADFERRYKDYHKKK